MISIFDSNFKYFNFDISHSHIVVKNSVNRNRKNMILYLKISTIQICIKIVPTNIKLAE